MKNFIEYGRTMEFVVDNTAIKSGDTVVVGDMIGVAITNGEVGETITLAVEGVYALIKGTGVIKQGQKVYANVTDGVTTIVTTATTSSAANTFAGHAWAPAASSDATVDVKLDV